jgi:hypothetical protein
MVDSGCLTSLKGKIKNYIFCRYRYSKIIFNENIKQFLIGQLSIADDKLKNSDFFQKCLRCD